LDSDFFFETGTMHQAATAGENLISLLETEGDEKLPVDDITIDLGLMAHDTAVVAGEVFIDKLNDGVKTDDNLGDERYTVTVQQSVDGATWSDVAVQTTVNSYRFEDLAIFDDVSKQPFQYRTVVTEIPLW